MPRRAMTPNERLVGRHFPKEPRYLDLLMAGFLKEDGTPCGRMEPSESHLRPAHKKAKKQGWIRASPVAISLMGSKPSYIFYLTESGIEEAKAAKQRVLENHEQRRQWNTDFMAIRRAAMAARAAREEIAEVKPGDVPCPWK
jgi:DNA-binding PadR family transcriptional regulator